MGPAARLFNYRRRTRRARFSYDDLLLIIWLGKKGAQATAEEVSENDGEALLSLCSGQPDFMRASARLNAG
jgi:hypothetical protein